MAPLWVASAIVLRVSISMRVVTQPITMPVILPADIEQSVEFLKTTFLINPRADVQQALRQPYTILKEELAFWMERKLPEILVSDINVYYIEEIVHKQSVDDSRRFDVTWFLHGSNGTLTKEEAKSTIQWRWTTLPWSKSRFEGMQELVTTLWVENKLANKVVLTAPYRMLKDELVFWMGATKGITIYDHDITISRVEYKSRDTSVSDSKRYDVVWNLNFFNGRVSKENADQNCVWRDANTYDRYEMMDDLSTILYFDGSFNEHNIATNLGINGQLQERIAAELELRPADINITNIEKMELYDVYGGRHYRVTWRGRCPQDTANKIIEWGERNDIEILTSTVSVDPRADVQRVMQEPYTMLKDELAHWMNLQQTTVSATDINIRGFEELIVPGKYERTFSVSWFLYKSGEAVTKEMANSRTIVWRWTNLLWAKESFENMRELVTTFYIHDKIVNNVSLMNPHNMLKDELEFWMKINNKKAYHKDITISKVQHNMRDNTMSDSQMYDVTWNLNYWNGYVWKENAAITCVWRESNTFDRHNMTSGLTTTFYFDTNFNDLDFVTNKQNREKKLQERMAMEFELRPSDITITNVGQNHVYDLYGGRQYFVTWIGRFSQEGANKTIEWAKPPN